jgi:hypothetical protein
MDSSPFDASLFSQDANTYHAIIKPTTSRWMPPRHSALAAWKQAPRNRAKAPKIHVPIPCALALLSKNLDQHVGV